MKTESGEIGVVVRYAPIVSEVRLNFARDAGGDVVIEPGDMILVVVFPNVVAPPNKRVKPTACTGCEQ